MSQAFSNGIISSGVGAAWQGCMDTAEFGSCWDHGGAVLGRVYLGSGQEQSTNWQMLVLVEQ